MTRGSSQAGGKRASRRSPGCLQRQALALHPKGHVCPACDRAVAASSHAQQTQEAAPTRVVGAGGAPVVRSAQRVQRVGVQQVPAGKGDTGPSQWCAAWCNADSVCMRHAGAIALGHIGRLTAAGMAGPQLKAGRGASVPAHRVASAGACSSSSSMQKAACWYICRVQEAADVLA